MSDVYLDDFEDDDDYEEWEADDYDSDFELDPELEDQWDDEWEPDEEEYGE
jgi:hypothetical protein